VLRLALPRAVEASSCVSQSEFAGLSETFRKVL